MSQYAVSKENLIYSFGAHMNPILTVPSGSSLTFHTVDALGGQIKQDADTVDALDFSKVNPATGPVAVEGAEPGGALRIDILDIETDSYGVILAVPGLGVLGNAVQFPGTKVVPVGGDRVFFDSFSLKKQPMIGVIGTAPASGSIACGTPGDHGGNMDTRDIRAGHSLYLPVFQPGGQLAMGDVHAAMGDGEVCGTGVECGAKIHCSVHHIPSFPIRRPLLVTPTEIQIIASAETVEAAAKLAVEDLVEHLVLTHALAFNDAYMLASLAADVRISQLVDPLLTVRACLDRRYLDSGTSI